MEKKCSIEGCNKRHHAKGYCMKHYNRLERHGDTSIAGNKMKSPLYNVYNSMKQRCYNVDNEKYKGYGGRGIKICDRRLCKNGFTKFCEDMGERPEGTSIDRIDNDGDYSPENCERRTRHQQATNTRTNNKDVGVCWSKQSKKRRAYIAVSKKNIHLGFFTEYKDAVQARKEADIKYGIIY